MIKALRLSLTAVVICAALHDKSERKSPVGPRDRERKPGVSFPFGRVFRRISPRQGWAIAYAITHEPTSLRTGRALTGTALRNCGRQGDDTPKGRLISAPWQYRELLAPPGVRRQLPHFASQVGTHFYSKIPGGIAHTQSKILSG